MAYYPCSCNPCPDCDVVVPACASGLCMRTASLTIHSNNSILPCNAIFSVDVGAVSDNSACTTTVVWGIVSFDEDAFTGVTVDSAGVVTGTTTTAMQLNTFYTILGKVICTETLLSQYFTIKISVKNICLDIGPCPEGESCNPCTGECEESVDAGLS